MHRPENRGIGRWDENALERGQGELAKRQRPRSAATALPC